MRDVKCLSLDMQIIQKRELDFYTSLDGLLIQAHEISRFGRVNSMTPVNWDEGNRSRNLLEGVGNDRDLWYFYSLIRLQSGT